MNIKITQIVNTQDLDFTGCHIKINKRGPAIVTDPAGYAARIPRADIAYLLGDSFSQLGEAIDAALAERAANACECDEHDSNALGVCGRWLGGSIFRYRLISRDNAEIYLDVCRYCYRNHLHGANLRPRVFYVGLPAAS